MTATVLYMSMSLDGFIAGPNEGPDNGLGDGEHRLHEWYRSHGRDHAARQIILSISPVHPFGGYCFLQQGAVIRSHSY